MLSMMQLTWRHLRRYEGQMQSQRLRMVSDSELRLEQFQAERKDEKRRYEDALDRVKQVCSCHASCCTHTHTDVMCQQSQHPARHVCAAFHFPRYRVDASGLVSCAHVKSLDPCLLGNSRLSGAHISCKKHQSKGSDSSVLKHCHAAGGCDMT